MQWALQQQEPKLDLVQIQPQLLNMWQQCLNNTQIKV